jgi:hypothetical protein
VKSDDEFDHWLIIISDGMMMTLMAPQFQVVTVY